MTYLIALGGLYGIAACAWGAVNAGVAEKAATPVAHAIERANKADRVVGAFNVLGASVPAFSVEIANSLKADVTVRDRDGSALYRTSPTERTTIVAKRV